MSIYSFFGTVFAIPLGEAFKREANRKEVKGNGSRKMETI